MLKKVKGFTLIELLIVVAIIGILAALVLPNAILAIQKAKQKETMKDIVHIATACADYVTSTGFAPGAGNQSGALTIGCNFVTALAPTFIKVCPVNDQWGNPYRVYTGSAVSNAYSIPAAGLGDDDFVIASYGRDGALGGNVTFTYQVEDPTSGIYRVNSMEDFKNDLVNFNGSWIHAPKIASR